MWHQFDALVVFQRQLLLILHGLYLDIMRGDKLINCVMIKNGSAYAIDIISGFAMKYYPTEISCWKWKILI